MVEPSGVQGMVQDEGVSGDDGTEISTVSAGLGPYGGKLDFSTFARATGGEVFFNRNNIDVAIKAGHITKEEACAGVAAGANAACG